LEQGIQIQLVADVYGRLFNVIGDAIDGLGNLQKQEKTECLFSQAPKFEDLSTSSEVLFTGIIDLIEPYSKG
jgi:F-type H+-transporting ATPase subunit beta